MTFSRRHVLGRIDLNLARELGWGVTNVGEAQVALALKGLGYTPADMETQYRVGRYRLDFAILPKRIDIEADGWVHTARSVAERDMQRDQQLTELGWTVIRIDIEAGYIDGQLSRALPAKPPARRAEYPPSRVLPGALARLAAEDWGEMTAAANSSPNHVSSDERWENIARQANPSLDDDQAYRLGQMLKRQHYQRMGRLSAKSRAAGRTG